jgi:hypothetical protein
MAQPSEITLSVNTDNDDGTTAEEEITYSHFQTFENRSEYISEDHTLELRDKLVLYRTFPKTAGNFRGTAKTAVKTTKDHSVEGVDNSTTIVAPGIIETSFSFPVGMTEAQKTELRMRHVAMLSEDTVMLPLQSQQMI